MSRELDVGIRIRVNNDGSVQVLNQTRRQIDDLGAAANNASQQNRLLSASLATVQTVAGAFGVALGAVGLAAFSKNMLGTIETVQNLDIRLQGLTESTRDYANVQAYLSATSKNQHKDNLLLADSFAQLLTIEQTGVITRKQSQAILEGLSNVQSKTGASGDNLRQSMIGLTQALGMGTLAWEEMKQVTEPLPGLMSKIAEAAGFTGQSAIGDFKELTAEGAISSDMFGRIMVTALNSYQGAAEKNGQTLTAQYTDIANAWTDLARVVETPVADVMTPVLRFIARAVEDLSLGIAGLMAQWARFKAMDFSAGSMRLPGQEIVRPKAVVETAAPPANGIDKAEAAKNRAEIEAVALARQKAEVLKEQAKIVKDLTEQNKKATLSTHEYNKQLYASKGFTGEALTKVVALADDTDRVSRAHTSAGHAARAAAVSYNSAARDNKRAQEAVAKAITATLAALDDQHKKLTLSERDYFAQSDALMKMSSEQKTLALVKWDIVKADEAAKTANDKAKAELAELKDKYDQLTLSAQAYYAQKITAEVGAEKAAPLIAQHSRNAAIAANQQQIDDARAALDSYNTTLDVTNEKMSGLAATTTSVFDGALGGINTLAGALDSVVKALQANSEAFDTLGKKQVALAAFEKAALTDEARKKDVQQYALDVKKAAETKASLTREQAALDSKNLNDSIDGIRQVAGATAAMFEENEAAQRAMQAVQGAALMAQAGIAIASAASRGDGYTALARAAAMAAFMATVIAQYGGGVGVASAVPPTPANSADTGTVLGDKTAQSQSVGNVYDLLKSIHAEEYAELRGINKGVTALSGGILNAVTKTFQTGAITGTEAPHLGMSKYKLVSGGLATGSVDIASLLAGNADIGGQMFTTEQLQKGSKKKPSFSFIDYFTAMDDGVTKALTGMFSGIGQTMSEISGKLGNDIGKDLSGKLNAAIVPALKIDILGLSGEDAVKKVNAVISTAMDTVAAQVFGDIVSQYQKLGEGMLETAVRIVSEVAVVRDALDQSGQKMADNAIELSDALVQAAGGLEQFQQQFEAYYDKFFNDNEKQARAQQNLTEQLAASLIVLPKTREAYRQLFEALNLNNELDRERYSTLLRLSAAADSYYSSLEQQITTLKDGIASAKDALSTAFKNESNELTTTINTFNNFAKALVKFRQALTVGDLAINNNPNDKYLNTRAQFDSIVSAIKAGPGQTTASKAAFETALGELQNKSQSFLSASREHSTTELAYARDYSEVLQAIDLGITGARAVKTDAQQQLSALKASVKGLIKINDSVLLVKDAITGVQTAVALLQTSKAEQDAAIKTSNDAVKQAGIDRDNAKADTAEANRINSLQSAYAGNAPSAADYAVYQPQYANAAYITGVSQIAADAYGQFDASLSAEQWRQRGSIVDELIFSLMNVGPLLTNVEDYKNRINAIHGSHANGLARVPFDGYVAKLHRGERVLTAKEADNYNPLTMPAEQDYGAGINWRVLVQDQEKALRPLIDEVKRLRQEALAGQGAIAANTRETAKLLRKFDVEGLPDIREDMS